MGIAKCNNENYINWERISDEKPRLRLYFFNFPVEF